MNTLTRTLWLPFVSLFEALTPFRSKRDVTQIVPEASISGRALFIVITIMSFLASLTAGSVYMINQSAQTWFNDIASEVTVQVNPINGVSLERRVAKVSSFLQRQSGIKAVNPLTLQDSSDLLEPWLGKSDALKELPIPRLIAVRLDQRSPANLKQLGHRLSNEFQKVKLDDHRQWQDQIRKMTSALAIVGFSILFFVGLATIAIVLSATRAAMAANKDIIEVLHFVGAQQHFIAQEFEKHFLVMGIRASLLGALMAAFSFFFMPSFLNFIGGHSGATGEYQQLFGSISLNMQGYISLLAVIVTISAICMLTSRYWVDRILRQEGTVANPVNGHAKFSKGKKASAPHAHVKTKGKGSSSFASVGMKLVTTSLVALITLTLGGFFWFLFTLEKGNQIANQPADGIVAFTGAPYRINDAVKLLSQGKAKRLLISGVGAHTQKNQIMRQSPSSVPLFNCCIDIGRKAQNTIGNAKETRQWIRHHRFNSVLIVTSNYHLPRSILLTQKEMPKIRILSYAVQSDSFRSGSWWYKPATLALLFQEYLKYGYTLVKIKLLS